jgi:anti-anti-sigma factor
MLRRREVVEKGCRRRRQLGLRQQPLRAVEVHAGLLDQLTVASRRLLPRTGVAFVMAVRRRRAPAREAGMRINHSTRDDCLVVSLTGQVTLSTAPQVRRALRKGLAEQPLAVICDLSGVDALDPACATVFATVATHPASPWPATSLLLCAPKPAVAEVLGDLGIPHFLPLYASVEEALDQAASRPPSLQQELRLAPTPTAPAAARLFVRETLRHWRLDPPDRELAELAQLLADELVTNAVVHARTDLGLRLELRADLLHIAVRDFGRRLLHPVTDDPEGEHGRGLRLVDRLATACGVDHHPGGGKVVWCALQTTQRQRRRR